MEHSSIKRKQKKEKGEERETRNQLWVIECLPKKERKKMEHEGGRGGTIIW